MIWIILAAGLGANFIVVTLLFRRLRGDLNRQLRDMRAEHNSESILRVLRDVPEDREQAAQAANGEVFEPPPTGPSPVRRKKHLDLYISGGLAALGVTLSHAARESWQSHRGQLVGAVVGATAAATTTVTLLTLTPWQESTDNRPPASAPTAVPTATAPPGYTQPPPSGPTPSATPSSTSGPEPSTSPTPSESAPPSPTATASLMPIIEEVEPAATATTSQPDETPPPSSEPPPAPPEPEPTPPAEPPLTDTPAGEPPSPPAAPALCAVLAVATLLNVEAYLLEGVAAELM